MSTLTTLRESWKARWEQFLAPTLLLPEADQERARLLTTLVCALLVFIIPLSMIWVAANEGASHAFLVTGVLHVMVIGSLSFSRTRYYRWSARSLILMMLFSVSIVFAVEYFAGGNPVAMLKFLIFATYLASVILSLRETVGIAIIWFVLIYVVSRMIVNLPEPMIINELAFNGVASILTIVSAMLREEQVRALKVSGNRYRALFEQSNDAVFIMNLDGTHRAVNSRASGLLGYQPDELMAMGYRDVVVPRDMGKAEGVIERLLAGKSVPPYERTFRRKDGTEIPVEINVELVRDEAGRPLHIQSIVREITARKKDEDARIQVRFERERSQILTNFVRGAAHEFRTPLSVIGANTYLLMRDTNPENKPRRLGVIDAQIDRVNRLVDLMLTMVRLDSGEAFTYEQVNVTALITSIVESLRPSFAEKSLQIALDLLPDPPMISGDAMYLSEAFRHLIHNAIRFTPEKGSIAVTSALAPDCLQITVRDSGVGIAPDQQEHIFERFYRTDESHSTEGFGLGLSIARMVVQRHDGQIEVSSTPGEGSTFRVILPTHAPDEHIEARG